MLMFCCVVPSLWDHALQHHALLYRALLCLVDHVCLVHYEYMYLVDLVHVYLVDLSYLTDLVYLLAFAVPGLGGGHRKIGFEGTHFPVAPALPFPSRAVRQLPHRDRAALPTVQRQGYQGTFFFFF